MFEEIESDRNGFPGFPQTREIRFRISTTYHGTGKSDCFPRGVCVCVCDDFCGWTVTAFQEVCVGVCVCV